MDSTTNATKRRRIYESDMVTIAFDKRDPSLRLHRTIYAESKLSQVAKPRTRKRQRQDEGWDFGDWDFGDHDDNEEEENNDKLSIEDHSKDTVSGYIDWLYHDKIEGYENEDGDTMYHDLVKLWSFGDKIQDDAFCNAVMKEIIRGVDRLLRKRLRHALLDFELVGLVYAVTSGDCTLRHLLVECTVELAPADWYVDIVAHGPSEFVMDLLKKHAQYGREGERKSFWERRGEWLKET